MIVAPVILSHNFDYEPRTKTFVAEISSLTVNPHSRVFDDACDEGFQIQSVKTGNKVVFTHVSTDTDGEDVAGWWFEVYNPKDVPELRGLRVLIIND